MRPRGASIRSGGLLAAAAFLGVGFAAVAISPGEAKGCRRENVPPGVRVAQQVGCKPTPQEAAKERAVLKAGRRPGFIDLGNGTELRISGDAGLDAGYRR